MPWAERYQRSRGKACIGKATGFTLLELLLAISLAAMVVSAVYAAFIGAVRSNQRVERVTKDIDAWRFFAERLRGDLKNLWLGSDLSPVEGEAQELKFGVVEEARGVVPVRYHWEHMGVEGAIRRVATGEAGAVDVPVYEGGDQVTFKYLLKDGWGDRFSGAAEFPRAVACEVTTQGRQRRIVVGVEVERVARGSDS